MLIMYFYLFLRKYITNSTSQMPKLGALNYQIQIVIWNTYTNV